MRPGETRRVVVDIDAQRYGPYAGFVTADANGPDTARVRIHTFIFP